MWGFGGFVVKPTPDIFINYYVRIYCAEKFEENVAVGVEHVRYQCYVVLTSVCTLYVAAGF